MNATLFVRLSVLALAIAQPIFAYVSSLPDTALLMESADDALIIPAGYAFAIWAPITFGALLYAIYQILPSRKNVRLYDAIALYSLGTFAGFCTWLYAASSGWLIATIVIFFAIGFCLFHILRQIVAAARAKRLSPIEQIIVHGPFGLYAGWATIAIPANIASVLVSSGYLSGSAVGWQIAFLILATGICLYGIRVFRGSLPYAGALLWAFVGIVFGTLESDAPDILTHTASLGTLCIALALWYVRRTDA